LTESRESTGELVTARQKSIKTVKKIGPLFLLLMLLVRPVLGQSPTGTIAGVITDHAGTPILGVRVRITNRESGLSRSLTTSEDGTYAAPSLPPSNYFVVAEAEGFSSMELQGPVETGKVTTINFMLQVGQVNETVTVGTTAPLLQYEQHHVGGLVNRNQIESLPVNGRNFLEFAKFEPGLQPPGRASSNRMFVPALGQPGGNNGRGTRVTVDGGSIMQQ
jgi:hypothetical protein